MKKTIFFALVLALCSGLCAENGASSSGRSSESSVLSIDAGAPPLDNADNPPLDPQWGSGNDVDVFVCDVKAGNCVFLRGPKGVVVLDAGSSKMPFNDLRRTNKEILAMFDKVERVTFVATHTDKDHCNFIAQLAADVIRDNPRVITNFCVGGVHDSQKVKELKEEYHRVFSEAHARGHFQFLTHTAPARTSATPPAWPYWQNAAEDSPEQIYVFDDADHINLSVGAVELLLTQTLGSPLARFRLLVPINGLVHPEEPNAQSLVILFEHAGSSILFTGDATGETLEAILGDRSASTSDTDAANEASFIDASKTQIQALQEGETPLAVVSAVSKRNRRLLRCVNLLMEPHHGSDTNGSAWWVPQVIELSADNFCGVLSSSDPLTSQYGQARHMTVSAARFPESARSCTHKRAVVTCTVSEAGYKPHFQRKAAKTTRNIFQTSCASAYQILLRDTGMSIYYYGLAEPQQLTAPGGFSLYTQKFWDFLLQGEKTSFWQLCGATQANTSLLKTATLYGKSALVLQMSLLPPLERMAFLLNVAGFLKECHLNPEDVFGEYAEISTLSNDVPDFPTPPSLESSLLQGNFAQLPTIRDLPVRRVYGGDQGIHQLDVYFEQNPDAVLQLRNDLEKVNIVAEEVGKRELTEFLCTTYQRDAKRVIGYVIRTIAQNVDVLTNTMNVLEERNDCKELQACLNKAVQIANSMRGPAPAADQSLSGSDLIEQSLLEEEFDNYLRGTLPTLIGDTVDLLFSYEPIAPSPGPAEWADLRILINLIPPVGTVVGEEASMLILEALLDNVFMGGWCARGFRDRLFAALLSSWQSCKAQQPG